MADQVEVSDALMAYVRDISLREDPVLRELRETTAGLPLGTAMQLMPEEGQLLALLVKLCGAARVVDLGTFTGYSALAMAEALEPGGKVVTCDNSARWLGIAEEAWQRAGVTDRIESRIGDGLKTLGELADEFGADSFDLVFIDADKVNYPEYYESALTLLRPGGLIVIDNTLLRGRVIDPEATDPEAAAVRVLNSRISDDSRVDTSLLVMADGITLARKR
ncbi:O-methyltransferase [Nocardia takedensis]|uniref:O-methyltransferase n=1 Tax=Nocardia takedensis TaxID=259390 RepID=UPI00030BAF6E|nr:class I SAM-dependent methyltransferase [Nocardia takedensis]